MNPSYDQIKSAVRTLVASLGGLVAGLAIGKGWITQEQANAILSNSAIIDTVTVLVLAGAGAVVSLVAGIYGQIDKKQANMIAAVAAMPDVARVETMPTQAGADLARAVNDAGPVPGAVVAVTGH